MRHARKAAAQAKLAVLLCATLCASPLAAARASNLPGGTSAPAPSVSPSGTARSGGTAVSASSAVNTGGSGGPSTPSGKGTGGAEYGVPPPKPKAARKAARRKPAHSPRRSRLTPKPKSKAKPQQPKVTPPQPAALPPAPRTEAGVPSPAQTTGEGALFPVLGPHSFGDAANRFGAGRTSHIHEGQDVLASEGLTVVAPLAGTIITAAYQAGGAGWYAGEHTVDGLDFFYAHCQAGSLAVSTGQAVSAGQSICHIGQTGDATGPHLHFEIWVGGWQAATGHPIDPLAYFEAWDHASGG